MTTEPATSEQTAALDYLGTGSGEPWRWAEGGEGLVWTATGGTVAFREELIAILEWLAPAGLPPFPVLALLLAACRGHRLPLDEAFGPPETSLTNSAAHIRMRAQMLLRGAEILSQLDRLQTWPKPLLAEPKAKALLAEAVLERGDERKIPPAQARQIIAGLRDGALTDAILNRHTGRRLQYMSAFQALEGLRDITSENLAMRLKTGLDEPIAPAPLPDDLFKPPAELARLLLDHFQRQPEHAGLARVARDLLAALSLPRRLPEPDDAATGGVADVANRGSLDKLLLSELANDDLTLATRVALNEALYLRHEPSAAARTVSVALLLDAGVRLWGVPRLFAVAAALALGASDARRPALSAWRAHGSRIEPVDLLTAAGFQNHLGALSTDTHPGAALPAFFTALSLANGSHGKRGRVEIEAVILTHRDTLADAAFRRALEAQPVPPGVQLLVASVDRSGRFELSAYPAGGKAPICQAMIRLDEIQRAEAPAGEAATPVSPPVPLLDPRLPEGLPVILSLPDFPFLLPVHQEISASCPGPDGRTLAVTAARTLVGWEDIAHGAKLLASALPAGRTMLLQTEAEPGRVHILKELLHEGHLPLSTYNVETGNLYTVGLDVCGLPLAARVEGGVILLFYPNRVDVFRLNDGVKCSSFFVPKGAHHIRGRYYSTGFWEKRRWHFASWDGFNGSFSPISGGTEDAIVVFDRDGRPGPWVLTTKGEVLHLDTGGKIFSLGEPLAPDCHVSISRGGPSPSRLLRRSV